MDVDINFWFCQLLSVVKNYPLRRRTWPYEISKDFRGWFADHPPRTVRLANGRDATGAELFILKFNQPRLAVGIITADIGYCAVVIARPLCGAVTVIYTFVW